MDVLYLSGEATVAEVLDGMPEPPSYSAVRATLRVLEEKGQVAHRQDGSRYVYSPLVEREQARRAAMSHLVRTFFDGSPEEAAVALLRMADSELDESGLERLVQRIDQAKREGR